MTKYKASVIKSYFESKGIVFTPRYVSSKQLYQWVIKSPNGKYLYPFSNRMAIESELVDMEFPHSLLVIVFVKIMNLKEYKHVKISVEDL